MLEHGWLDVTSEEITRQLLTTARTAALEVQHSALTAPGDQCVFEVVDNFLTRLHGTLDTLAEPERMPALIKVMREILQVGAWLVRSREERRFASGRQPPRLIAVFLYGVNIPGGRRLDREALRSLLTPLPPGVEFVREVGDVDNLLFAVSAASEMTEEELRLWLARRLRLNLITIPTEDLSEIKVEVEQELRRRRLPTRAPYRFTRDGAMWEIGLVLASDLLPEACDGEACLFGATTRTEALRLLRRRALLVLKRCATGDGTRIMWGSAVINPWAAVLRRHDAKVRCLSSRSLGAVARMLLAADDYHA
jgi:hypothetical protein